MKELNPKKIVWCENWLRVTFAKYPSIERNFLFRLATKAGLYTPDTYGSELSVALGNLGMKVKVVNGENGEYLYSALSISDTQPVYDRHGQRIVSVISTAERRNLP